MFKMNSVKKINLVDLEMSRNVQTVINLVANLLSFAVSLLVSFFLSPYIVKNLGAEANGFVTLANNFVSYAMIIKTALNSIGSRYIIMSYHKGEIEKANKYYSSIFFGDLALAVVFAVAGGACIWKLEMLINVPRRLVVDVKLLFLFIFCDFVFNTVATIFNSAPYIKNKVYLQSIRDIQSIVARGIILVVLFSIFVPKTYFLGIAIFIPGLIQISYNIYYKKRLVPELKVRKKDFSIIAIRELISQGVWNSVSSLGAILLTSLDLLIANLFIGAKEMGILSISRTFPNVIIGLGSTMSSVFFSAMTIDYAKKDIRSLINTVKQSCMLVGGLMTIPLSFLIVYGREFYALWQPTMNSQEVHILSVLTCASFLLCAGCNSLGLVFTMTLHIKESALSVLGSGIISTVLTLLLVKYTDLGVFAIAGVSSFVEAIRMLLYIVPVASEYLGLKRGIFYPVIIKNICSNIILCLMGVFLKYMLPCDNWLYMILSVVCFGALGLVTNFIIVLDKEVRNLWIQKIKIKLKIKSNQK